jgi:hypothetical protein
MTIIVAMAIGFAALKNPTIWWASGLFTVEIGLLGTAFMLAFLRRGRVRSASLGFVLFGFLHLTYSIISHKENYYVLPPLLIEFILLRFPVVGTPLAYIEDLSTNWFYHQVAYSIGTLVFASVGGVIGGLIGDRGRGGPGGIRE